MDDKTAFRDAIMSCCDDIDYSTLLYLSGIAMNAREICRKAKEIEALTDEEKVIIAAYRKAGKETKQAVMNVLQVKPLPKKETVLPFPTFLK